ncbi:hypothetical protein CEXT_306121 [Caerostris extrusa]|uniref:Ribosomal protein S10 n=1 Tax=Caerostris extrusa TaxID=172846 RepID=A0AAV4W419_CAEEX|nr:hypothetical protein CEXT_306121 [Caerostris extrusa]
MEINKEDNDVSIATRHCFGAAITPICPSINSLIRAKVANPDAFNRFTVLKIPSRPDAAGLPLDISSLLLLRSLNILYYLSACARKQKFSTPKQKKDHDFLLQKRKLFKYIISKISSVTKLFVMGIKMNLPLETLAERALLLPQRRVTLRPISFGQPPSGIIIRPSKLRMGLRLPNEDKRH